MTVPRFQFGRPQRIVAMVLLLMLAACIWIIERQQLTQQDYNYARCGREMWEKPSPLAGYFTTCGNLQDGTFAYRAAGLPLTIDRIASQLMDKFRKPEERVYSGESAGTSIWEMRHQLKYVLFLEHLPFALFAVWLGGGIWWVSRRLFGNDGGFLALCLYCTSPLVLRAATTPNNDILAAWGLYGTLYTAIGVAHAMQGPKRKWKPRIVLLIIAVGLTACASIAAAIFGFITGSALMLYLAERRRAEAIKVLALTAVTALGIVFASYSFSPNAMSYLFRGGAARVWFGWLGAKIALLTIANAGALIAFAVALLMYLGARRSRYFGNTVPLVLGLLLLPLITTQVQTRPWLWALPFLFTFAGGVWADVLETRWRKAYLALFAALLVTQCALTYVALR